MKYKILVIISLLLISGCYVSEEKYNNMEQFYKDYGEARENELNGISNKENAEYSYDLWSWAYDEGMFLEAVDYCENARGIYSLSNEYYQDSITYYKEAKKTAEEKYIEYFNSKIEWLEISIERNWYMYEVCEYYESACKKYYYNNYITAGEELEKGNEKIKAHDRIIVKMNEILSRTEMLEEKLGGG